MEISEINSKMRYYENAIEENIRHISRLNEEIRELETLKNNLYSYQNEFNNANSLSKSKVGNIIVNGLNVVTSYIDKMNQILTGDLFHNANRGIEEAVSRVYREIEEKKDTLDLCYRNIDTCHRNIDYLHKERYLEEQRKEQDA